jgi:rhodanese-related sulfurtransferase
MKALNLKVIMGFGNNLFRLFPALVVILSIVVLPNAYGQASKTELPKEKQTTLGLYVTSAEAYDMWKPDPDKVKILDVRTPEEYIYVGHAPMAWNIPAFDQVYEWDSEKQHFPMKPNPKFMDKITKVFKPDNLILVTCRSGGRSAMATNQMAAAGFKKVYNITDGFEGDKVEDPNSVFFGERMVNGWKNSGLPYTYKIDPKLMLIPEPK